MFLFVLFYAGDYPIVCRFISTFVFILLKLYPFYQFLSIFIMGTPLRGNNNSFNLTIILALCYLYIQFLIYSLYIVYMISLYIGDR